jgi:hypothetical protein
MHKQGKYYQPDHWPSYQYPGEQAHSSIVGIRLSDAKAFCEWLTNRDGGDWKFRLPTQQEAVRFPMKFLAKGPLGHWINEEPKFTWVGSVPIDARGTTLDAASIIASDYVRKRPFDNSREKDLQDLLDWSRIFSYPRDVVIDFIQSRNYKKLISRIIARSRNRKLDTVRIIDIDGTCERSRNQALDLDYIYEIVTDLYFNPDEPDITFASIDLIHSVVSAILLSNSPE